jgi:hypothetical protein
MHKICATDSAVAPSPDSLTRAATLLRIAEVRQARALGSLARCRKAEPCSATTGYNINWINWLVVESGVASWHYIPGPTRPIYRGLTTRMSAVSLGWTQQPPGGLRGERCYILWRVVPKQKQMRQVFTPDLASAKPSRNATVSAKDLEFKT